MPLKPELLRQTGDCIRPTRKRYHSGLASQTGQNVLSTGRAKQAQRVA